MSMQYMLDSNVLSALIREPRGVVAKRVRGVGEQYLCCSIVVAGEIQFGVENRGSGLKIVVLARCARKLRICLQLLMYSH